MVKIAGKVSNIRLEAVQEGYKSLAKFTVTDNSGSIEVFSLNFPTIKNKDSVCIIGKFFKERKIGQFVVGKNEIDATVGQLVILKGWYVKQQQDQQMQEHEQEIQEQHPETINPEDFAVTVNQLETPSTQITTYATIIGVLLTTISFIPVLLRKRRFNIDLKIISSQQPQITKESSTNDKFISIEILLHNLNTIPPEISSSFICQIGKMNLIPTIKSIEFKELKFPVRIERTLTLKLFFKYENTIQHFANNEKYVLKLKDEFCSKTFKENFNFIPVKPDDKDEKDETKNKNGT